jgi:molybdopterin-guanine dinucleotide biosynthesis protein A
MTISAVLLTGGKSRRMGKDKATMQFRGVALWEIQLELLRGLQFERIFVSGQNDPPWRPMDAEFVPDAPPSRGPLSGIAAALSRVTTDYLLALGIDIPFMTQTYLQELCPRIKPGRGVVPIIDNRFEPLAAIYPRNAQVDFAEALVGSDFSLQSLIRKLVAAGKLSPIEVSTEEKILFRNLNEPQDFDIS